MSEFKIKQFAGTLRRCKLLAQLDTSELTMLAELVEVHSHDPQHVIYDQGEEGSSLFVLAQGRVEFVAEIDGTGLAIGAREPVQAFGELSLLIPGPRLVRARCSQEVTLLELTHGNLRMLSTSNPPLGRKIVDALRERAAGTLNPCRPLLGRLFAETLKRAQKR